MVEQTELRQYLLGQLDPETRSRVETTLFTDEEVFEQCCVIEHELIDAYASNALPDSDKQLFERRFLNNPEQCFKIEVASALRYECSTHAKARHGTTLLSWPHRFLPTFALSWRKPLLVAAMTVFVAIASIILIRNGRISKSDSIQSARQDQPLSSSTIPGGQIASTESTSSQSSPKSPDLHGSVGQSLLTSDLKQANAKPIKKERTEAPQLTADVGAQEKDALTAVLSLSPNVTRGVPEQEEPTLKLQGNQQVTVDMATNAPPYRYYRCIVRSTQGTELLSVSNLRRSRQGEFNQLSFRFNTDRLTPGSYIVTLLGSNDNVDYSELELYSFEANE
jgi:hypothetical protein